MLLVILKCGIPNRRIELEIALAQTYANNRIVNHYYSSAAVHIYYMQDYFIKIVVLRKSNVNCKNLFRTDRSIQYK